MPRPAWWNLWLAGGGDDSPPEHPGEPYEHQGPLPPDAQGLTDLARGMQHVAQCTQDILGQHFLNVLNHYFDPETGEPIEKRIKMPNGQVLDLPLIALVPPTSLALKQLRMKMAVAVNAVQVKTHKYDPNMKEIDRARFNVSFAPSDPNNVKRKRGNGKMMDMEMVFEAMDPPEAMHRIIELFTAMVEPQDPGEADQYGSPKNGDDSDDSDDSDDAAAPPATADADDPAPAAPPRPHGDWLDGPDRDPNAADTPEIAPPDDDSVSGPPTDPT